MKINVIHVGYATLKDQMANDFSKLVVEDCGSLELEKFNEDTCWYFANWSCWTSKKPKECANLKIRYCNSDAAFHNPETDKWYVAEFVGWCVANTR